ncbi:hypothetical protein [Alterisphingorhabdus coralli]|uniref:Uncharacterized protein n=1 Tax=Alterisphingorhabdus coralli TaxID=3071408 RepID=A0AA97FAD8_9SPHN|nr:hypothetical protein [Parasphingorhabdus sp. SCSIO 66989]WOE76207.1 hypothetical protein RB602_05705 [Parasphingorhabdus sp. SCSIO 66989]
MDLSENSTGAQRLIRQGGTFVRLATLAGATALLLSACGVGSESEEEIDAATDPAIAGALEEELLVDPDLVEQANRNNALDPQGANTGAVPAPKPADVKASREAAVKQFGSKGIMNAPEPKTVSAEECPGCEGDRTGVTLGAKADIQAGKRGKAKCNAKINYDAKWAARMPPELPVYPKGNVTEAAGVDGDSCNLRAVTFTTGNSIKEVVDYYYTKARRARYSAEYLIREGEHTLGGVRQSDDAAYVIFLRKRGKDLTEVDIVANNGR